MPWTCSRARTSNIIGHPTAVKTAIPVKIVERRAEESNLTRAFAIHARTLELLDMRGLADGLTKQGIQVPRCGRISRAPSWSSTCATRTDASRTC
ncbi:FAD-dependent monooxygenase [Nonomuraea sp. G32]|nr:FAD-dependent monooxygenase [Nonomuraea sp. G32]MDP4505333.1 FAD-dependent monooxygenase [Nonomuraea sp. G32]